MSDVSKVIDIHSHFYPPSYIEALRARSTPPLIRESDEGLIFVIFPNDRGRPMDSTYWDLPHKLEWMRGAGIDVSIISLGNPWVDPFDGSTSAHLAATINQELGAIALTHRNQFSALGVLPSDSIESAVHTIRNIAVTNGLVGIISGTRICGRPLDDEELHPIWRELDATEMPIFIHPHHGLSPADQDGYGSALPIALSFPFETTIAAARLVFSGTLTEYSNLRIILAHGGGALPTLAARLDAVWRSDAGLRATVPHPPSQVLQTLYADSLVYDKAPLAGAGGFFSPRQILFGSDHPFSIADGRENVERIRSTFTRHEATDILGGNAIRLLRLSVDDQSQQTSGS